MFKRLFQILAGVLTIWLIGQIFLFLFCKKETVPEDPGEKFAVKYEVISGIGLARIQYFLAEGTRRTITTNELPFEAVTDSIKGQYNYYLNAQSIGGDQNEEIKLRISQNGVPIDSTKGFFQVELGGTIPK